MYIQLFLFSSIGLIAEVAGIDLSALFETCMHRWFYHYAPVLHLFASLYLASGIPL